MAIITAETSRRYLERTRLPDPPRRGMGVAPTPPVELKSTEAQALVVGSGLVVAADQVAKQTRQDIVDCTLFAQLAASGAATGATKVSEWYAKYFEALSHLGWAQSNAQFESYKSKAKKVEAHKAIVQVLAALLGPQAAALAIVRTTFDALQSMSENTPWIALFDRQSASAKSARFQVATAEVLETGLVQIALVAFTLTSRSRLTQVLFFKFGSNSTQFEFASGKATIYEEALATQRQKVSDMLQRQREHYIGQVRFPPPPA